MYKNKLHYLRKMETLLLPYTCILCKKMPIPVRDLCSECEQCLPTLNKSCARCAYPISESIYCESCETIEPPYDSIHTLYLYKAPIMQFILELKFKHVLVNARLLGELMAQKIKNVWYADKALPDIILPIPLHFSRMKERGFNQAVEIARPIAKVIQRPLVYDIAQRIKATSAQATLNLAERRQNMQQAFIIRKNISHLHIAVIDDVITTGETIREFCKMLKQSGAAKIDVWCCARAMNQVTFGKSARAKKENLATPQDNK
ncbi:MAG: ComF family protein [Gammaproteobacteria bacterium]|nr:ComF family protein [Gammaproteobacteria bacterium]